jgi:hypothetical protein
VKELFETSVVNLPDAFVGVPYETEIKINKDPERKYITVSPTYVNIEDFKYDCSDESIKISFISQTTGTLSLDIMSHNNNMSYGSNVYIKILPKQDEEGIEEEIENE